MANLLYQVVSKRFQVTYLIVVNYLLEPSLVYIANIVCFPALHFFNIKTF